MVICNRAVSCKNKRGCEHATPHEIVDYIDTEDSAFSCTTPYYCEDLDEVGDPVEVLTFCVPIH